MTRDWEAAERRFRPPSRLSTAVPAQEAAMPTYQQLLIEFERRTSAGKAPSLPAAGPSPADLFSEFEKRTGKTIDV